MRHMSLITGQKPLHADALTTLSAFIDLLTSIVALTGEVSSVFGISALLNKKSDATS